MLTTQRALPLMITVERHFIPGVGMVFERLVQAIGGRMISRQEMALIGTSD